MLPSCKAPSRWSQCLPALAGILAAIWILIGVNAIAIAAERKRIGIAMPSFRENRWQYDIQSLEEQAELNQVDILVRFAANDQNQQNLQIKELINLGVDLLMVTPANVFTAAEGIRYAKSRAVPVLCYDRLAENCEIDIFVTFNRLQVGELMGRYLANAAPRGKYILLHGPKSDSNAAFFSAGAMKHLQPLIEKGEITVVLDAEIPDWRQDVAERLVEQVLTKTTDIVAVLAPNNDTAGDAITALKRHNLAGKVKVTGQDATEEALNRLNASTQSMTVYKNTSQLAKESMKIALTMLQKQPVTTSDVCNNGAMDVPACYLPVVLLDTSSLDWFLRSIEFQ